jgi:hypothetical protein
VERVRRRERAPVAARVDPQHTRRVADRDREGAGRVSDDALRAVGDERSADPGVRVRVDG